MGRLHLVSCTLCSRNFPIVYKVWYTGNIANCSPWLACRVISKTLVRSSAMRFIYLFIKVTCYSAPSRFLLRGAPDYSADTESEFHAEAHEQLRVKDLPRVPTRRLEVDSNPQPSGCKAPNIPLHHRAPRR